jgi:hypothetical protein
MNTGTSTDTCVHVQAEVSIFWSARGKRSLTDNVNSQHMVWYQRKKQVAYFGEAMCFIQDSNRCKWSLYA